MGGIIKSKSRPGSSGTDPAAFNFEDMSERAEKYLEQVREQATKILLDAKQQAQNVDEKVIAEIRTAATRQATERLEKEVERQLESLLPAVRAAVEEIDRAKQAWLSHWQHETVKLACAIAERVIRRELRSDPEITVDLLREALELSLGSGELRLHMHPTDIDALGSWIEKLSSQFGELATAEVVPDESIAPGGCRVSTQFGVVDQTIDTQLARIAEELC